MAGIDGDDVGFLRVEHTRKFGEFLCIADCVVGGCNQKNLAGQSTDRIVVVGQKGPTALAVVVEAVVKTNPVIIGVLLGPQSGESTENKTRQSVVFVQP